MIFKKYTFLIFILIVFLIISALIAFTVKKKDVLEKKERMPEVAIVIDDFGYNRKTLDLIYSIKKPLTLAVLPNLPYSKKIATEADREGYEIILHLPLEPHEEDAPMEKDTILVNMTDTHIIQRLHKAMDSVPTLKGVSNHMGSKATEDKAVMHIIFKELKKKGLYFLDSLVTDKSICEELAKEMSMGFAKRDTYLDNIGEADYIKNQLTLLIDEAKIRGSSIGIGHDRTLTIKTIAEEMPRLEEEGIEFVFVSDLIGE